MSWKRPVILVIAFGAIATAVAVAVHMAEEEPSKPKNMLTHAFCTGADGEAGKFATAQIWYSGTSDMDEVFSVIDRSASGLDSLLRAAMKERKKTLDPEAAQQVIDGADPKATLEIHEVKVPRSPGASPC